LAVARVSSRPVRDRICRDSAAGLIFLYWLFIRFTAMGETRGSAAVRRCGVAGESCFFLTLAPSRTLPTSFC
jgi:hypothetical protein